MDNDDAQPMLADQGNQIEDKDKEIKDLKNQVEVLDGGWKRAVADYQNLEKRVAKEREDFAKFSNLIILSKLISFLENLEKAQNHLQDAGLELVVKELKNIISEQGVDEIKVDVGDEFDPHLAECVEVGVGESDNKIVEVIAKGYIMGNRVIRPAKVRVSRLESGSASGGQNL